MATIVRHHERETDYILVGAGFGSFMAKIGNPIFGDLAPGTHSGYNTMALVCDADGEVCWVDTLHISVISIDGVAPGDVLSSLE